MTPDEISAARSRLNAAIVADERGEATPEQRAALAAFNAAIDRRLIRDLATGEVIGIRGPEGPTYEEKLLPKPILEAFIALVGAAGGEIRVPERWQIDANQYELMVHDDEARFERVFRIRKITPKSPQ